MHAASEAPAGIAFGRFLVLPHRRELLADGRPVKLGGRAFDVLMALIDAHGAVVSKNALMARVWPDRIVEENNLQWQISALRAAFGADRNLIRTVSGRGYQFTAEIDTAFGSPEADAGTPIGDAQPDAGEARSDGEIPGQLPPTNLPELISELIGRDDVLDEILSLASAHRLVTLTGAGGIGKTRLALAAARRLLPQFPDGVWLAEFSPIADPGLVPVTVGAAIGLDLGGGAVSAQRVAQSLAGRRLVLVLDTCEHVISAAAVLAEAVLRAGGTLRLLATSREPLRAEGEWVYPVPPLAVPAGDAEDVDDLLRYGAVRLFVERLRAGDPHFAPDRRSAAVIAAICRRLDGIPLAIELAAARAAVLGVEEVATRLDDRFRILTGGRRAALPRHQTLRATLDWSYELLGEPERVVLRRLAVFAGVFRLEAARVVVASPEITLVEVADGIANLVAKSLVIVVAGSTVARCRLLDTMRAYALEKLAEAGECEPVARRHAEYYCRLFERAEADCETWPAADWLAEYGPKIDNLRAALDWAFSPGGDAAIGVALTAAAVPLWLQLSLVDECRSRAEHALAALEAGASQDSRREMKLQAALGISLIYTRGPSGPAVGAAWTRARQIADSLDDAEYRLRSLWGLWSFHVNGGRYRVALALAEEFLALAHKRPAPISGTPALGGRPSGDWLEGELMIGMVKHNLGDPTGARRHFERVLADDVNRDPGSLIARYQLDHVVDARAWLAWILWLQGFPNQAMVAAECSIKDARAANHVVSLCHALSFAACPIALWVGDLVTAERYVGMQLDNSKRHALARMYAAARRFQGVLLVNQGDVTNGLRLLHASLNELREEANISTSFRFLTTMGQIAEALGHAGQVADGLAAIEKAMTVAGRIEERWAIFELLRVKGELLLMQGGSGAAAVAEGLFRQALDWACGHGALSWELRAATSLARLLQGQGRSADALALLQPVYDRFTEGFDTADLKAAKAFLDAHGAVCPNGTAI
jgi:predicted ATPase/DNA-binding winged helix-turn-helix (wHTH) protein